VASGNDFYKILGVDKKASHDEIKKAYRDLVKKWHPDRNLDKKVEAEKRIKEINEAYEVLSDEGKRSRYDNFGSSGTGGNSGGFGQQGGFGDFGVDLGDIFGGFDDLFGMGRKSSEKNSSKIQSGSDLKYRLTITLEDAFRGKDEKINFSSLVSCDKCNSTGSVDGSKSTCTDCKGAGKTRIQQGFFIMERTCGRCGGSGEFVKNPCKFCNGNGRMEKERVVKFHVPPGVEDGTNIRLSGHGESGVRGGQNGDLYVNISIQGHRFFERTGNDLMVRVPVKFTTMALGGKVSVPTIDNSIVDLSIPANTQSETKFKIKGCGMPVINSGGRRGDMYVICRVEVPTKLSADQKAAIEILDKAFGESPNTSDSLFEKMKKMFE